MGRKYLANVNFRKRMSFLAAGALVVVLCAALATRAIAVNPAAQPALMKTAATALPAPGIYKVDSAHSFTYFGARHHVVGLVRGRFDKVTGNITVSPDPAACSVDIVIDVSSISTQNKERDQDLLSPVYFDVDKFSTMTYQGRGIRHVSANSWIMDGSLTLHGVTKIVPLTFTFNGVFPAMPPDQPVRVAFHGMAGVKRAEFGMGARDNLEELGVLTTPDVEIQIDVEADAHPAAQ